MPSTERKILVSIELDEWEPAVALARDLAGGLHAELILLHVVRPIVNVYPDLPHDSFVRVQQEVEEQSRRMLERIAESTGARTELRIGEPVTEILAAATHEGASMIVMGTHGRHGVPRLLFGSIAERVVRRSPIPVVTVHTPEKHHEKAA